jgi:hypothetical protein
MASILDDRPGPRGIAGPVVTIVAAIAAILSMGFLSGLPILLGVVVLLRARRYDDDVVRAWAWLALAIAVGGAILGYWMWQYFLWDMHNHPGGGGPVPAPTTLQLATMPLIAAGIAFVVFVLCAVARRYLPHRSPSKTHSRG